MYREKIYKLYGAFKNHEYILQHLCPCYLLLLLSNVKSGTMGILELVLNDFSSEEPTLPITSVMVISFSTDQRHFFTHPTVKTEDFDMTDSQRTHTDWLSSAFKL